MKQLICMISGKDKTTEQLGGEAWAAFQKYQKTGEPTIVLEEPNQPKNEQRRRR